ncbi:MAG TPA: endonuclease/exonuclease/phosphatase family protein [Ktedonobacterales bacterium]|nr:endonuclease/exonuclease/phosphatase family protein [Ktedonobacterales bacterium]
MARVISYNILVGGKQRVEQLAGMLSARQPDIIGLVEATDEEVVRSLAEQLGMDYQLSGRGQSRMRLQAAVLSRLPIRSTWAYTTEIIKRQPLFEVQIEEPDGSLLTVFMIHLTPEFSQGWRANLKRRREVQEALRLMAPRKGTPHLLMGDFNAIAPGDRVRGSDFVRYVTDERLYRQLIPSKSNSLPGLSLVLPRRLRFLQPALRIIPRSMLLSFVLDRLDRVYAPRGGLGLLIRAGYVDCFRRLHPKGLGFTWPSALPAGRIDYIFASPELAPRLAESETLREGDGVSGNLASDHLPVFAAFSVATCASGGARSTPSEF